MNDHLSLVTCNQTITRFFGAYAADSSKYTFDAQGYVKGAVRTLTTEKMGQVKIISRHYDGAWYCSVWPLEMSDEWIALMGRLSYRHVTQWADHSISKDHVLTCTISAL